MTYPTGRHPNSSPPPSEVHVSDTSVAPATEVLATQLEWVLGLAAAWATIGLLAAMVLRRRGHEFVPAAVMGAVFGPLFIPLAVGDLRRERPGEAARVLRAPSAGPGFADVLVCVDALASEGVEEHLVASWEAGAYGRVSIAAAIDYESAKSGNLSRRATTLAARVELAALTLGRDREVGRVLVGGPSPDALVEYGAREGYDVVIVRSRSGVPEPLLTNAGSGPPSR